MIGVENWFVPGFYRIKKIYSSGSFVWLPLWTMALTKIQGDILIDDKPLIKGKDEPRWFHVLFTAAHNTPNSFLKALINLTLTAPHSLCISSPAYYQPFTYQVFISSSATTQISVVCPKIWCKGKKSPNNLACLLTIQCSITAFKTYWAAAL